MKTLSGLKNILKNKAFVRFNILITKEESIVGYILELDGVWQHLVQKLPVSVDTVDEMVVPVYHEGDVLT